MLGIVMLDDSYCVSRSTGPKHTHPFFIFYFFPFLSFQEELRAQYVAANRCTR